MGEVHGRKGRTQMPKMCIHTVYVLLKRRLAIEVVCTSAKLAAISEIMYRRNGRSV